MRTIMFISMQNILLHSKSFRNNFEKLGYKVVEPEYLKFQEQNFIVKILPSQRRKFKKDFFHRQNQLYIETCEVCKPDFVFVMNDSRVTEEFLEYCKGHDIPVYQYLMDSIRFIATGMKYKHYYERIFSYEPSDEEVEIIPGKFVEYVPLCCDHEIYQPYSDGYQYDLCFVGNLDKRRFNILEQVAKYARQNRLKFVVHTKLQLKVKKLHYLFKVISRRIRYNIKYPNLMKCLVNEAILGKELAELYSATKICLNIHIGTEQGMHTGPNPRIFEILGCKTLELVDKGHLYGVELQDGADLIEYDGAEDLISKIDYYLRQEREREEIAQNGYNKVVERYTIEKVIRYMSNSIEEDLRRREA